MTTRGIPEVPFHPDPAMRNFLMNVREQLITIRAAQAALAIPSNVRVTAEAFSNLLQWTRVLGADYYEVLWSPTADLSNAVVIDVGNSAQWIDQVGNSGVTRFYVVRARKLTGARSLNSVPVTATTLASNAGVAPPLPPPPSRIIVVDTTTGHRIPYALIHGDRSFK